MKKIFALLMCACLVFSLAACSKAPTDESQSVAISQPETSSAPSTPEETEEPTSTPESGETEEMPDSETYFGTVTSIQKDEEGKVLSLSLTSETNGDYGMNVTENTVWVDAVEKIQASPDALAEGQTVYVYYSPVSTRSEPPQSEAFAIILNIPQDIGAGVYHLVEDIAVTEDDTRLLTNNGGLYLVITDETSVKSYETGEAVGIDTVTKGNHVIAWYGAVAMSNPGQAPVSDILVLPATETATQPQDGMNFEFKEVKVEGWETKETNASPENQYIKVTLAKNDTYVDIYKGAVKENLPSLEDAFTDGSGEGTFDDTITVTLGRMGGIYTYAAWESDGFFYVIDNPSGMTPDEINTFMEAILY